MIHGVCFPAVRFVVNFDECGVPKEVDMSDLDLLYVQPRAGGEVCDEFFPFVGRDKLNPVVKDQFATRVFQPSLAFQQAGHEQEDGVCHEHLGEAHLDGQGVDNGQSRDREQVGHFPDRHGFCTVTDDPEDGENTESETDFQFHAAEQEDKEEHADTD